MIYMMYQLLITSAKKIECLTIYLIPFHLSAQVLPERKNLPLRTNVQQRASSSARWNSQCDTQHQRRSSSRLSSSLKLYCTLTRPMSQRIYRTATQFGSWSAGGRSKLNSKRCHSDQIGRGNGLK